jgi:fatty-acyl-CoA synthase
MAGSRQATSEDNYTGQLLARLAARGARVTIVYGERRISGREAHDLVLRYAGALIDLGVDQDDGVALFSVNTPETLLLMLAVHFLGGRLVFVPPEPGNGELGSFIERADVKLLIFDPAFTGRAAELARETQVATCSLGPADGVTDFLAGASPLAELAPGDVAPASSVVTLFYTGGTTGQPKLVPHGHGFYERIVKAAGTHGSDAADPRLLARTLLSHVSGHFATLMVLFADYTVVLMPGETFDAGRTLRALAAEKITDLVVVPPMLYELLDHPDCPEVGFPDLASIYYLGAPTAPARLLQAIEVFGPVMHQVYGATETGLVTELWPEEHDPRRPHVLQSCGKPGNGIEIELRDEHGVITEPGRIGELYIRSAMVTEGYWRDPERTRELKDGEWARSGDLGYRDDEGYFYLVDRSRDIIVTGRTSDNVYSRLLDDFLSTLPAIRQAAAVGVPDPVLSEAVHVFLVPQDGADLDPAALAEIRAAVVRELGELYRPQSFTITDRLPYTTVGKVDKKVLRTAFILAREANSEASSVGSYA